MNDGPRAFLPGRELSARYYHEVVRPLLARLVPGLPSAAGLLGPGSEVLGFDTPRSTDHDWGPTVQVLLPDAASDLLTRVRGQLDAGLPDTFLGWPTGRGTAAGHRVFVFTLGGFARWLLDLDPRTALSVAQWLTLPSQQLLAFTAGPVHHDGWGELSVMRERLAWYPHDVWLYLMASGWQRIAQEEHLMSRAGEAGDELGSRLIAARLVQEAMRLGFLMAWQYAPYAKWFGSAFARLPMSASLTPNLQATLAAPEWPARMRALSRATSELVKLHNALALTPRQSPRPRRFHSRPYRVIDSERLVRALLAELRDPEVQALATRPLIGGIDQLTDSTDARAGHAWRDRFRALYS